MSLNSELILSGLMLCLLSLWLLDNAQALELHQNANSGKKTIPSHSVKVEGRSDVWFHNPFKIKAIYFHLHSMDSFTLAFNLYLKGEDDTVSFNAEEYEEIGPCSVTCGIGMKEVLLTKGCPGDEKKCVIRVEGCRGPVKCGWGKPVYISDDEVELQCIFTNPSKKYDFVWKLIATDQEPTILMDNEPTIRVEKEDQPEAYQCDTLLADEVVASIKYSVYTNTEGSKETRNSSLGVKSQIVLMAVAGGALMVVISIICGILFFCFKRSKQREIKKRPPPRPPLPSQYNSRKQPKRLSKPGAKIPKAQQPHSTQQRTRSLARPPLSSPKQPRWSRRSLTRPREPPPPTPSKVPPLSSSPRPRGSPSSRLDKQGPRPVPDNETSYAEEPTASYADYATAFDSTELMKHI